MECMKKVFLGKLRNFNFKFPKVTLFIGTASLSPLYSVQSDKEGPEVRSLGILGTDYTRQLRRENKEKKYSQRSQFINSENHNISDNALERLLIILASSVHTFISEKYIIVNQTVRTTLP